MLDSLSLDVELLLFGAVLGHVGTIACPVGLTSVRGFFSVCRYSGAGDLSAVDW